MQGFAQLSRGRKILAVLLTLVLVLLTLVVVLRVAYRGRIYPGVSANGVYLGGLTHAEAVREMNTQTSEYGERPVDVMTLRGTQQLSATQLGVQYNNALAANDAINVGRSGWPIDKISAQLSSLIGQNPAITEVSYDTTKLSDISVGINTTSAKQVENAKFVSRDNAVTIQDSARGKRVDFALLPSALANHFGQLQTKLFVLPVLTVDPQLSSTVLESQKSIIAPFEKQPLQLTYGAKSWPVDVNTLVSWLALPSSSQPLATSVLTNRYIIRHSTNTLYYDKKAVSDYLTTLTDQINVAPIDAQLTISDGKATVFAQSRDGKTLDIVKSSDEILTQLSAGGTTAIPLTVAVTKAEVSDDNIDKLGIKELISEGATYFPGSPPNRLHNIRVGAAKFNGILIKPGQNFSFNDYLGDVDAANGYTPGLVILGDREEMQYGGGLCQVSSTAYRAALLAGLPITLRVNHSFAIDYYTAPYGVPGVDATIYLPQPDMRFTNDTGHYILMQTQMVGTTLKFFFYGTKIKSGTIRGPFFVTGSNDATKPSQTVFYRDVTDLSGKVIKTDTVNTYYKSSLDFPVTTN